MFTCVKFDFVVGATVFNFDISFKKFKGNAMFFMLFQDIHMGCNAKVITKLLKNSEMGEKRTKSFTIKEK